MELFAYLEASAHQLTHGSEDDALQNEPTPPTDQHQAATAPGKSAPKPEQRPDYQARWQDDGVATTWWV